MLILPTAAQEHLARQNRRLTVCGLIEKNDGTAIYCTQHDEDIEVDGGDLDGFYLSNVAVSASDIKSGSDMSVDNLEISSHTTDDILNFGGFSFADIEAGLFANAPFQTFICQWDNPTAWQKIVRRGYLGEIKRTAEGQFQAEWRGLFQPLQQMVGRTLSERCDVKRFGDLRCKLDVDALEIAGTVVDVTGDRQFEIELDTPPPDFPEYFTLGEATWLTGLNSGYTRQQIKRDIGITGSNVIQLWESMPHAIEVGDRVRLRPGCDRIFETCRDRWNNAVNHRGHGRLIPGIPAIIRAP